MKPTHQTEDTNSDNWQEYKLNKISIDGFKSLRQIDDFEIKNLNVLVGANGTGKSNFLDFFEMVGWMVRGRNLQRYVAKKGGADDLLFHGSQQTSSIGARFYFSRTGEKAEYTFRLEPNEKNHFIFTKEEGKLSYTWGGGLDWQASKVGLEEADINYVDGRSANIPRKILEHCAVYQFHDTSATSKIKMDADIDDIVFLNSNGGNLAAILYDLRENNIRAYKEIESCIGQVLPVFAGFDLIPLYEKVMLRWWHKANYAKPLGPNLTSDGTLRLMALTTLLCMPKERIPSLVLLDEPELGLHPYATAVITSLIKRLSIEKQVIVATQSPQLLNDLTFDDIVITEMPKSGATSFKRPKADEYKTWLENSQLGDMWQANAFGGNP